MGDGVSGHGSPRDENFCRRNPVIESTPSNLVVEMKGIVKRFPGVLANDHVDFELRAGRDPCPVGGKWRGQKHIDECAGWFI